MKANFFNSIFLYLFICLNLYMIGSVKNGYRSLSISNLETIKELFHSNSIPQIKKPSPERLYTELETRSDSITILKHSTSTLLKNYSQVTNNLTQKIDCYYQDKRIIRVENRTYFKTDVISFRIFDFDPSNKCIICAIKNKNSYEIDYYLSRDNFLSESNWKSLPQIIDDEYKKELIPTLKTALDSTMAHFPEFKYSFDWK